MRYASVCDGIGAAHVAWQPLGWECAWTSEIEPFPAAVVDHHWKLKNLGDMTAITEEMLHDADDVRLLVGGTPCQSFSVAGLRGGLDDPRGNLALRFVQLVGVMRPEWVVWENVPGVLSSNEGRDFGTFLGALAELGYGFAYRVLDAQWFGVAQRRRRVFVVAHARDWRRAAAVLFERESLFGNPPARGAAWERTSTAAALSTKGGRKDRGESSDNLIADTCGTLRDNSKPASTGGHGARDCVSAEPPITFKENMSTPSWCVGTAETLQAANGCAVAFKPSHYTRGKDGQPSEVTPTLSADADKGDQDTVVAVDLQNVACGGDVAGTLDTTRPSRGGGQAVAFTKAKRAQSTTDDETWVPGEVAPTFNCFDQGDTRATTVVAFDTYNHTASEVNQTIQSGTSSDQVGGIFCGMAVRRLTPRECERLQGFPDDYTAIIYRGKPASDGPRYRALGNSMAVPVMHWIGRRIAQVEVANG